MKNGTIKSLFHLLMRLEYRGTKNWNSNVKLKLCWQKRMKSTRVWRRSPRSPMLFGFRSVLARGALSDKVAAHILLLQHSAPHNLFSLSALVQMSQSKGKREYLLAMFHLKDLFLADLLPQRKLKPFNELVSSLEGKRWESKMSPFDAGLLRRPTPVSISSICGRNRTCDS